MYQFLKLCQKTISLSFRNQSEISQKNDFYSLQVKEMCHLIVFWQFLGNVSWKCLMSSSQMCQKSVRSNSLDTFLTVYWLTNWPFSDTILKTDTFLMHFQIFSDRFLTQFCIWLISDRYQTHLWLISDWFLQLTVFWQISDRYLTVFWNFWDLH